MKSSLDSAVSDSILAMRIQDRNNSHQMQAIQAPETFIPISHPSPSRSAGGQPIVHKREAAPVSYPTLTEREGNDKGKSPMKHGLASSTSEAFLLGQANVLESLFAKSANLSMNGFQNAKKDWNSKRDNILPPMPEAAIPGIASTEEHKTGKESNGVSMPEYCVTKRIDTEMERANANRGAKPLQMPSERINTQPHLLRESIETKIDTRSLHRTSKTQKRSAELALPFISKTMRFDDQAFPTERSTSSEIFVACAAPQTSENRDFLCIQNTKSIAAEHFPCRHPKVASSTDVYPRESSSTATPDFPGRTSSIAHHTSMTTANVQNRQQTMMESSSQIGDMSQLLSPKTPSMINITATPAMKKAVGPNLVSKMERDPKSHSLLTCVGSRDIRREEGFANQASPIRTIVTPSNGSMVNQNRDGANTETDHDLPERTTLPWNSRCVKKNSVCRRPPVSQSSASEVLQSKQVNPQLHRSNAQKKSSTMVQRHATKFTTSKNTCSTTLIPTIRKVTASDRTSAVRQGSENVRFDQKGSVVPAMVQKQIAKRSDVEKKQDNTHFVQRRVAYNLAGNVQRCENQSLTHITQSSTDLQTELHKKQPSVNPPHVNWRGPTIMNGLISYPNEKTAAAMDLRAALKRLNTDSVIPASPPTQTMRSPAALTKDITEPQATRAIHHSMADKRTQLMRAASIAKEDPVLRIPRNGKARGSIGSSLPPMAQGLHLSHLPESEKRFGTEKHSLTRKMVSAIEKENAKKIALTSTQQSKLAGKQKPILQSGVFERKDSLESTKADEMSGSQRGRGDMSISPDQNGTMTIANMSASHHKTPSSIANQLVKNTSPENRGSCPNANGNIKEPTSCSSAGASSDHIEGITVVELPYGSPKTITLKEEDMGRHIPVWNTKLKYKVAGTAAPLGKNIARYLNRKMGEFEVYNEQEKFESEETRKNARVTLWHKIEKRKISGTSAPLRKNIERYLREHPHCETYVDQQSQLDSKEKRIANARVTVWNKNICRRQGFGQSGPLRKNLKRYLLQHPHLEEYVGQDRDRQAVIPTEDSQEAKVSQQEDNSDTQADQHFVDSEHRKGRKQNANEDEGYSSENRVDVVEQLEPFRLDPIEEFDGGNFEVCNSADPDGLQLPIDMSNIPDLNIFPFRCEKAGMEQFELDEDLFPWPGYERQLDDLSDYGKDASIRENEMGTHLQDAVEAEWGDKFVGEVVPDQMDAEESRGDDSEPLQVAPEPLDSVDLFLDLEIDDLFKQEDIIIPQ